MVQLIRWNTETDEFEHGQWFKGRIYERYADLSPSGDKLIYLSANYRQKHPKEGSYIVISRPPYLTALALFSTCGMRDGCGFFHSDTEVGMPATLIRGIFEPEWGSPPVKLRFTAMPPGIYFAERQALAKAGWKVANERGGRSTPLNSFCLPETMVKELENSSYVLILQTSDPSKGHSRWHYSIANVQTQSNLDLGVLDWADLDKNGDILFANQGKLFRLSPDWQSSTPFDLGQAKLLFDFLPTSFSALEPPQWAQEWPPSQQ